MDKQIQYLQTCLPAAEKAGGTYDMNLVVILAQGALEAVGVLHIWPGNIITISVSWGTGASNGYWHGERAKVEGTGGVHYFRHYAGCRVLIPRFCPSDPHRLPPCLEFQPPARSLCERDSLQPLYQRAERR